MSYTKEQRKAKASKALVEYLEANGTKNKDGVDGIVWDTWPVCCKDKCYDKLVLKDGMVYAVNPGDKFTEWRNVSMLDTRYLDSIKADLQKYDAKVKKK